MTHITSPREIFAAYLLAVVALSASILCGMLIGGPSGSFAGRFGLAVAGVLVLVATFAWGSRRGFYVKDSRGRVSITNISRNLVMSAIMAGAVLFVVGQVVFWSMRMTK